ncbi:hypothetical protein [Atlantibacter subterraneus]|uniref:hypothetical protein n=1 Tax=Atlantibacter subterraneus TaxID=255519 RepID=UPI00296416D6|nr:hypothetical protein [Atlantibacter subterranea]MDW2743140.1 hypothetical protein [Atlantibacter subterranea]
MLLDLINHPVCVWLRELTIYGKLIRKEEIQAGILNGVVALISWDNERGETADFIGFYVGAHNVYYVKLTVRYIYQCLAFNTISIPVPQLVWLAPPPLPHSELNDATCSIKW